MRRRGECAPWPALHLPFLNPSRLCRAGEEKVEEGRGLEGGWEKGKLEAERKVKENNFKEEREKGKVVGGTE